MFHLRLTPLSCFVNFACHYVAEARLCLWLAPQKQPTEKGAPRLVRWSLSAGRFARPCALATLALPVRRPWPPRHWYILYIARIPSVLALSGPRRKLAHKQHSLRQRLVSSASCSAPWYRLRGLMLRDTPCLVGGSHPLRRSRAPKKQTGSDREHCSSAIKSGASRELSHGITFSHAHPLVPADSTYLASGKNPFDTAEPRRKNGIT